MMKALEALGILIFFVHYYLVLTLVVFKNASTYFWKLLTQPSPHKQHIHPHTATHSHVFVDIDKMISLDGYDITTHLFQTADRASVSLWRIQKHNAELNKPFPVLMMHGLLDSSASWFLHADKSKSLPYILAAQGYDVWVGNNRGNKISRHEEDHSPEFWEYCFDHLIQYDQPAVINGVLRETGKQKLIYIGHSQGSAQFLLGLGLNPDLQHKIAAFVGLGTVLSFQHLKSHVVMQALSKLYILELYRSIGFKRVLVLPKVLSRAVGVLVYNSALHFKIMKAIIQLFCGFSIKNKVPESLFGVIVTHEPGGSSINNTLHWVQCYRQGGIMHKFNYGPKKNMELYGEAIPPAYSLLHLRNLPFNSYLYRGSSDSFMSEADFSNLVGKFNPERVFARELHDYNHLDYVWSESAHHDLYDHILQIAEKGCN